MSCMNGAQILGAPIDLWFGGVCLEATRAFGAEREGVKAALWAGTAGGRWGQEGRAAG